MTNKTNLIPFTPTMDMHKLERNIRAMHQMYNLPDPGFPTLGNVRHKDFQVILQKEFSEGQEILEKLQELEAMMKSPDPNDADESQACEELTLDILTAYADWLEDIQVYCHSEMMRLGIRRQDTNAIIAASNLTKLGADGEVIKDENGKVTKGPNFLPPEPTLREMIKYQRNMALKYPGMHQL